MTSKSIYETVDRFGKVAPIVESAPAAPIAPPGMPVSALLGVSRRLAESRQTPASAINTVKRRVREATGRELSEREAVALTERLLRSRAQGDLAILSDLQWRALATKG